MLHRVASGWALALAVASAVALAVPAGAVGTQREPSQLVPFDRPRFLFSGLYRPAGNAEERGIAAVEKATARFVPLGVPLEATLAAEADHHLANEEKATAAFKLRVALPGSLGPELTAKVQSLRALPGERSLGEEAVGPSVAPPGGPGWPDNEVVVRLRRLGVGSDEGSSQELLGGEAGPLGTAYQLYESVETVLLVADPRARRGYERQDAPGTDIADEQAQCRRCDWPGYPARSVDAPTRRSTTSRSCSPAATSAPSSSPPTTGRSPPARPPRRRSSSSPTAARTTRRRPAGPRPPEPPTRYRRRSRCRSPSRRRAPRCGAPARPGPSVALPGGELLVAATDREVAGRAMPFSLARTYRSGMLGYGPLGSAGWSATLFAHLRELPATGEVEYHDGMGHVWRFFPKSLPEPPPGTEADDAGSYYAPQGVYLRLQKLPGGRGWRLLGRGHDAALFDGAGRLVEIDDRHVRGGTEGEQGSRMRFAYDAFGQLATVIDDLGRHYRFAWYDDPRPEADGGDGARYGLLEKVTDFVDREVAYEYDADRRLIKVKLPEVDNPVDAYAAFSYTGAARPTVEYRYDPQQGVSASDDAAGAVLHGDFAKLRLASWLLPDFVDGTSGVPRARFEYDRDSGRLTRDRLPDAGQPERRRHLGRLVVDLLRRLPRRDGDGQGAVGTRRRVRPRERPGDHPPGGAGGRAAVRAVRRRRWSPPWPTPRTGACCRWTGRTARGRAAATPTARGVRGVRSGGGGEPGPPGTFRRPAGQGQRDGDGGGRHHPGGPGVGRLHRDRQPGELPGGQPARRGDRRPGAEGGGSGAAAGQERHHPLRPPRGSRPTSTTTATAG